MAKKQKNDRVAVVVIAALINLLAGRAFAGEWVAHQASLNGLSTQISALEGQIQHAQEQLKEAHDPTAEQHIVEEIKELDTKLKEETVKYKKEYDHVRFQHPEKGEQLEVRFAPKKSMPDSTLERAPASLQDLLVGIKSKMVRQYGDYSTPRSEATVPLLRFQRESQKENDRELQRPVFKVH